MFVFYYQMVIALKYAKALPYYDTFISFVYPQL